MPMKKGLPKIPLKKTSKIIYPVVIITMSLFLMLITLSVLYLNLNSISRRNTFIGTLISPTPRIVLDVPEKWNLVDIDNADIIYKLERESTVPVKPTIVAISTDTNEADYKTYTDSLLKGTLSTIPSMRITTNTVNNISEVFTREVTGYYLNASRKIDIKQNFYGYRGKLLTLTATTDPRETLKLQKEIQILFDNIQLEFFTKLMK